MLQAVHDMPAEYDDAAFWRSDYLVEEECIDDAKSNHSRGSILLMTHIPDSVNMHVRADKPSGYATTVLEYTTIDKV